MLIIFSDHTSKILPRILCIPPKHCAPIIRIGNEKYIMFQFVRRHQVAQIYLTEHAIKLLQSKGWRVIKTNKKISNDFMIKLRTAYSCVDLCKKALNIHNPFIQTPRELYKKLKRH